MQRKNHDSLRQVILVVRFVFGTHARKLHATHLFQDQLAPILALRCLPCHGESDPQSGFPLHNAEAFFFSGYVKTGNVISATTK